MPSDMETDLSKPRAPARGMKLAGVWISATFFPRCMRRQAGGEVSEATCCPFPLAGARGLLGEKKTFLDGTFWATCVLEGGEGRDYEYF